MAAGNIKIQANDTRIYTLTPEDGAGSNVDLTIPKDGGKLATNVYQSIAASRMLAGDVSVTNTVTTQGMNTTLYTGNGSTQSVVTGIDMDTQWGNDASEKFGGLVWYKSRTQGPTGYTGHNNFIDTIRGNTKLIWSNLTNAEGTYSNYITSFNNNGFSVGADLSTNKLSDLYASWNFQTTHRKSGTTNHGQPYECHYNPFTGFTIVKYTGSGTAGHEIPHHLGRKLGFVTVKNLSATSDWLAQRESATLSFNLNATTAEANGARISAFGDNSITISATDVMTNTSTNQYILYGWANSYYDDKGALNGNYEIGTYVGTGVAGNKVTTRGKPAWVMVKRLDSTADWLILNNQMTSNWLEANTSDAQNSVTYVTYQSNGFIINDSGVIWNASGGTYLYMVVYDTNANGGGTYYPRATDTSNLQLSDAQLMYSDGYANGTAKNTSEVLSGMTYPSIAYSAGYNYVKKTSGGAFSATPYEPKFGEYGTRSSANETPDIYIDGKWYSSASAPNLVTNGTFDINISGWGAFHYNGSIYVSDATNAVFDNGRLKIINNSAAQYAGAFQALSGLTIGRKYALTFYCESSTAIIAFNVGTTSPIGNNSVGNNLVANGYLASGYYKYFFIATETTVYVATQLNSALNGVFGFLDNISIFEADIVPATPLGNITYLPIKVLADANGQIVSAESWKYPEVVVDMIKAREYEGLPIASPTKDGISKTSLLAEYTVTGSACTSIDFSGLDINTHKSYRVEVDLAPTSSGALSVFINGDTVATSYNLEFFQGTTTVSVGRVNSAYIANLTANEKYQLVANVSLCVNNARILTHGGGGLSALVQEFNALSKLATVTNITQLTFTASVASSIGVGSKIRIYRGDV